MQGSAGDKESHPQRLTFNPDFKFGPPPGDMPVFRMTAFLPEMTVSPHRHYCIISSKAWPHGQSGWQADVCYSVPSSLVSRASAAGCCIRLLRVHGHVIAMACVPEVWPVQVMFEAEPKMWQSGQVRSRIAEVAHVTRLPFMRLKLHHACLDLATLGPSEVCLVHMPTYVYVHAWRSAGACVLGGPQDFMPEASLCPESGTMTNGQVCLTANLTLH